MIPMINVCGKRMGYVITLNRRNPGLPRVWAKRTGAAATGGGVGGSAWIATCREHQV